MSYTSPCSYPLAGTGPFRFTTRWVTWCVREGAIRRTSWLVPSYGHYQEIQWFPSQNSRSFTPQQALQKGDICLPIPNSKLHGKFPRTHGKALLMHGMATMEWFFVSAIDTLAHLSHLGVGGVIFTPLNVLFHLQMDIPYYRKLTLKKIYALRNSRQGN